MVIVMVAAVVSAVVVYLQAGIGDDEGTGGR